jgi:hypothetical protein
MHQLEFSLEPKPKDTATVLVDTMPTNLHQRHVINIGYEYVAKILNADRVNWRKGIPAGKYDTVAFNVNYPMHVLNIAPFLRRNGIPALKSERRNHKVIIGGPGAVNLKGALDPIADEIFLGELDGDYTDHKGWRRLSQLHTPPVIKNGRGVIEIARGCTHRCKFCEYSWVLGGKYREKPFPLVKKQIEDVRSQGIKKICLRTSNTASYYRLDDLMEISKYYHIYQGWADIALLDAERILPWLEPLKILHAKVGIESFDERTIVIQKKKCMFEIYFSLLTLCHIERSDTCECETSQAIA